MQPMERHENVDINHPRPKRKNCEFVDGVLLLDKPRGYTSNQALQAAKRLLHACKAGHTGSLDPVATGLLPLCFGQATKVSRFLLDADKHYWARIRLGVSTTTYDADGEVTAKHAVTVGRRDVERALARFKGEIEQVPPMYSAIKRGGQPLYKLARAGIEVARETRRVVVRQIRFLDFQDDLVDLDILCSKGTYIRTLAHDLGEWLGCGAHVAELRRLAVGQLTLSQAVSLEALQAIPDPAVRVQSLQPIDAVLDGLPDVHLTRLATHYFRQGQPVSVQHGHAPGWARIYDDTDCFLGMGQVLDDGRVAPRRLLISGRKS
jgi:tRNA pseudouridine55 synthase